MAQALVGGMLTGCLYALVGLGLALLVGVVHYHNFAYGQILMLTMLLVLFLTEEFAWDPLLSGVLVIPTMIGFTALTYFAVHRNAKSRGPHVQFTATLGLLTLIQAVAVLAAGPTSQTVRAPYSNAVYAVAGIVVSQPLVWAAAIAVVTVLGLFQLLYRTDAGKAIRAAAGNETGAILCGVDPGKVFLGCILLAGTIEAVAGVAAAPISVISPFTGFEYLLQAFLVIVIAGFGRIVEALIVSILLGAIESLANVFVGSGMSSAVVFGFLMLVMLLRPNGLFAQGSAERVG